MPLAMLLRRAASAGSAPAASARMTVATQVSPAPETSKTSLLSETGISCVLDEDHAELAARHEDALGLELAPQFLGCSDDVLGRRQFASHGRG